MKHLLSVPAILIVGFFCLSMADPIGQNRISWSEAFSLSVEKETELGERVFQAVQAQTEMIRVPSIDGYVYRIGKRLLSNADTSRFPIRFLVLRESEPNAFAIPGGTIFLTSGVILLVDSEDELAGVMAHEIAHVVRRHIAQRIEASKRLSLATLAGILAGILVGGSEGGAVMMGSLAFGESQKLKYTRENEFEADRLGLAYMTRAGYDGRSLLRFLKKISQGTSHDATFPTYLSTHPGVAARMGYVESLMGDPTDSVRLERSADGLTHIHTRLLVLDKGPLNALDYFSRLLGVRPDDGDAFFGRALAKKEMGRMSEAIEDLMKAHTLKPSDPQILKELGLVFLRSGRTNEGMRALERSLALSGNDAETLHYLGQGYQTQKRLDLAIENYLRARALYPDLPELDRDLGSAYREKGEMDRSHFYYGLYFKKRGQVKYARFHFEKAMEFSGNDPRRREELLKELEQLKR
jgi:predicted Zn-dependent protease